MLVMEAVTLPREHMGPVRTSARRTGLSPSTNVKLPMGPVQTLGSLGDPLLRRAHHSYNLGSGGDFRPKKFEMGLAGFFRNPRVRMGPKFPRGVTGAMYVA